MSITFKFSELWFIFYLGQTKSIQKTFQSTTFRVEENSLQGLFKDLHRHLRTFQGKMEFKNLLRTFPNIQGLFKAFQQEFCLLLPLLSSLASSTWYTYFGFISTIVRWRKIRSETELGDRLWTSNTTPVELQNKVMFLWKITTKFMTNLYWASNLHWVVTCPYSQGKNPTYKTKQLMFFICTSMIKCLRRTTLSLSQL